MKRLQKALGQRGYDLSRFSAGDTRRLEDDGMMPETGWKYYVSEEGRLKEKFASLAEVKQFLESLEIFDRRF